MNLFALTATVWTKIKSFYRKLNFNIKDSNNTSRNSIVARSIWSKEVFFVLFSFLLISILLFLNFPPVFFLLTIYFWVIKKFILIYPKLSYFIYYPDSSTLSYVYCTSQRAKFSFLKIKYRFFGCFWYLRCLQMKIKQKSPKKNKTFFL